MLITTITKGLIGGGIGTVAMTISENLEQRATGRADSYVPAMTAGRLLRLRESDTAALGRNLAVHWGTGIVGGAARALLSERGFRAFQRPLPIWLYGSPRIRCSRTLPVCPHRRGRGRI